MDEDWYRVTFVYRKKDAKNVFLVGDFCGWLVKDEYRMLLCDEGFSITLPMIEGFYLYKFVVDGEWLRDEWNDHSDNSMYSNSIMFVHMDAKVYGIRAQHPPYREYHRPNCNESYFSTHLIPIPDEIKSWGILERQAFVYLPPSYSVDHQRRYPVVYMQDGQNVFSTPGGNFGGPGFGGMWLDEKLDHYWSVKAFPEFILVAIPNSDFVCIGNRKREYCPSVLLEAASSPYMQYLVQVVKVFVDGQYRTLSDAKHTVIVGASMGGLLAFCAMATLPEVFGAAICMSPSFWYRDRTDSSVYELAQVCSFKGKVYFDSGEAPGDNLFETKEMAELLTVMGMENGKDFMYHLDEGSFIRYDGITHSEHVWKERILRPFQFVFGCNTQ